MSMGSAPAVSRRVKSAEAARTSLLKSRQPSRATGAAQMPAGPESASPTSSPAGATQFPSSSRGVSAGAGGVHEDERLHAGALLHHRVDGAGDVPGRGGDDGLDVSPVQAIGEVVLLQHEGGRHRHRPQFLQGQHREPELVVAAQDDHDEVAAADAAVRQEVRRLVRPRFHVGEGEGVLLPFRVAPDHGRALGIVDRDVVHDVVGEVEVVGHGDVELREQTVLVVGLVHVAQVDVSHDDILG